MTGARPARTRMVCWQPLAGQSISRWFAFTPRATLVNTAVLNGAARAASAHFNRLTGH